MTLFQSPKSTRRREQAKIAITLQRTSLLCLTTEVEDLLDAGSAYAVYLRDSNRGAAKRLGDVVTLRSETVNPQSEKHRYTTFEYMDLAEVEETLGAIVRYRQLLGKDIASNKIRFGYGDILFAKIRPSIDNKKVAYVFQEFENAIASTEFLVLTPKEEKDTFFIFGALRSDEFNSHVIASCGGDTGRQRIRPSRLLDLIIPWPAAEIRQSIGKAIGSGFDVLAQALALQEQAIEVAETTLGKTSFQTAKPRRKMTQRAGA